MARYIAFLGSINVGGNRLSMAELRHALEREDFEAVETVVASGNVLFDYDERPTEGLEELIAHVLADRFDIDSFVAVRSAEDVRAAIEGNPFAATGDEAKVHTMFLSGEVGELTFASMAETHATRGPERLALGRRCLYIDYVEGVGGSRLSHAFIERRLGCRGTSRNIRSLRRILDKMQG